MVAIDQRKWNWLDTFLFFMRTLWIYYNASWVISVTNDYPLKWLIFFWFVAIYLVPLLFYRPGYIHLVGFFIIEAVLTGTMFFFLMNQFQMIGAYDFLYLPLIMIAYVCQLRPFIWIGMVTSVFIFMMGTWLGNQFSDNFIEIAINTALFYMMGFCLGRVTVINNKNKKLIESIQEKNKALEQYSQRIEELTIMEERNRVAQDLHDTIGHTFTSIIMSLDALPFIIKANQEEAVNSIQEINNLARNGLDDVRKSIHQISPIENHWPLSQYFHQVISEFTKHTGIKVDYEMKGSEKEIGERIKYTFIRCLQEGLTNAVRHGQATQILVTITYDEEVVLLQINDNGIGTDSLKLGFGLQGMKDRISSLNGSIIIKSELTIGTELSCSIPFVKDVII